MSVLAGLCRGVCAGGVALVGTADHGGAVTVTVLVSVCHIWWLRELLCGGAASSGSRHVVSWGVWGATSSVAPLLEHCTSNVRAHLIHRRGREELAVLLALNI